MTDTRTPGWSPEDEPLRRLQREQEGGGPGLAPTVRPVGPPLNFSDAVQLAIVHEAETWCPGCGAVTTERFVELLIWLEKTDRRTFDRAIAEIVTEVHHYEGEAQAA